ncbi:LLM class flavin-dependent oxidoreductase [Actinomycetospora lutea]|uniref:LLM class flavin-dependent oxidoreductase n=1 Tax=Actinomycetospora lutea TaxID=663604 RepID=UPI0023670E56|nr:LLM class flavin-dependent oxidoreductase [Actinomycetospora lutea]MDD7942591.1 LLM class flavin-dependent oxidoreductase [Actinomycetospora lutea]
MRLGTTLPQFGDAVDEADRIGAFAAAAEEAGAASLWVGDRLLAAVDPQVGYAGTDTVPVEFRRALDPFALLAVAAAATSRAVLGTSVLVGPLYPPAVLARSLGTISAIAGARLVAGLGIGWSPEEYAGAGLDFDHRGARLDELLDGLDTLWSDMPAPLPGPRFPLPAVHVDTPRERPAVYLSAWTDSALRRVGRRADGWLPVGRLPADDLEGQARALCRFRANVDAAATEAGRDPADVGTALRVDVAAGVDAAAIADGTRRLVDATGFTDVFVDPMYAAPGIDATLELVHEVLRRVA